MIAINLIQDLIDITKNDSRHHIKIVIDGIYFTVYIDDDSDETYEERYVIPIRYDCCSGFCYILHDEYCDIMHNNDFGIDLEEINLIQKIMQYMENNNDEIEAACYSLSLTNRKKSKNSVEQFVTD